MRTLSVAFLLFLVAPFGRAFQSSNVGLAGTGARPIAREMSVALARNADDKVTSSSSSFVASTEESNKHERRAFLQNMAQSIVFSAVATGSAGDALAAIDLSSLPKKVTQKVYLDVRVSRADGTFYVRDSNPNGTDGPDDQPFYGRLVLGLFGEAAPNHVERFMNYVDVRYDVDNPLPSYSRSKFGTLDTATGLLIGGTIPGLDVTTIAGGNVLEYSGRVFPAKLWLENNNGSVPKLPHDAKGLLTHRNLDPTPAFGITTRRSSTSLDATHTVFGVVLEDEGGFLDRVVDVPVLTDTGRVSRTSSEPVTVGGGGDVGGSIASSVFTAQRAIFRDAAKTFGDTRLEKVYDGKLLRRIEVTKVGVL